MTFDGDDVPSQEQVRLRDALRVWGYIGLNSFGGPAGQIAVMHREVVARRRWLSEKRFVHALNFCMVLPGPEAQQLATYIGWLMNGVRGGVAAGSLFVLPGFVAMLGLSLIYAVFGSVTWVSGIFAGLQAAVVILVIQAFLRIARRTLSTTLLRTVCAIAFFLIAFVSAPFPVIVLAAGIVGWRFIATEAEGDAQSPGESSRSLLHDHSQVHRAQVRRALLAAGICAFLWAGPVIALVAFLGTGNVFTQEALLFSKAAVVTFGGAYAVLGYVAQQAVGRYRWITPTDMATGLGLAETTPGPLIMVVQFVGFLAASNSPGSLNPIVAGILGSVVAVWVTFLPCFLFIFLGAPFAERLRGNRALAGALSAVGASVTGVVLSLGMWFALHTLFTTTTTVAWGPLSVTWPDMSTITWSAVLITGVAAALVFRLRMATVQVLGICAILGMVGAVLFSA